MRITNTMVFQRSLREINANRGALADVQQQIASGKRIQAGSDDPAALAQTQAMRRELSEYGGYLDNIGSGKALLQETEGALGMVQDVMLQLQDRMIQAGGGAVTGESLGNYKREIQELRENLRQLANARDGQGRYLFGGWKTTQEPYPADLTLGPNGQQQIRFEVARGTTLEMSVNGDTFIGETQPSGTSPASGDPDLFRAIDSFVATLGFNPGSTYDKVIDPTTTPPLTVPTTYGAEQQQLLKSIQTRLATVTATRTSVAERIQRLEGLEQLYQERVQGLTGRIDALEAVDLPTASLNFARYDAQFKAALSVSARTLPTSLVDYLR